MNRTRFNTNITIHDMTYGYLFQYVLLEQITYLTLLGKKTFEIKIPHNDISQNFY